MAEQRPSVFDMFKINEEVTITRIGKKITVKGRDGTFSESDTVESNLLLEILKAVRKNK